MSRISTTKSKIGSVVQDDRIKKELLRRSIVTAKCRHRASHLLLRIAVHYYHEGLELPPLKEGTKHTRFLAHVFHPHPERNDDGAWELGRSVLSLLPSAVLDHFQDVIRWPAIDQVEGLWRHVHCAATEYATNLQTHVSSNYKTFIKYTIHAFCDKNDLAYIKRGAFINDLMKKIPTGNDHTISVFQVAESDLRFELFLVLHSDCFDEQSSKTDSVRPLLSHRSAPTC